MQDLLAADIAVRGTPLAAGGLAAVLADLHPQVRLIGSRVLIGVGHAADVALDGRGLTLLPTAWGGGLGAVCDPPWQPVLSYPARGTSATPPPPSPQRAWLGCSGAPAPPCSPPSPT